MLKRFLFALALASGLAVVGEAQISVPNTLVSGHTIASADLNTNFSTIANHALDRLSGGTISGNVTVAPGITIDGIDIGATVCPTCAPTFKDLTLASPATGLTVGGNVIVNSTGKIPALTSTYFTSLAYDAANLTGTVATARVGSGSPSSDNFLRGDGAWANITAAKVGYTVTSISALYTAATTDEVILASGTFTVTLYTCVGNAGKTLIVKNTGTGTVTLDGNAAETIDGALTFANATQYLSTTLVCDGSNWSII
jgi:hypothetical protein